MLTLLQRKVQLCSYSLLLVAKDKPSPPLNGEGGLLVEGLYQAWHSISKSRVSLPAQEAGLKYFEELGAARVRQTNPYLWRFQDTARRNDFFLLLTGKETWGLPSYQLHLLSNLWQLEHRAFPVHACGIIREGQCYLFSGPSGAGKSTIAEISRDLGYQVLDEDQVLIRFLPDGQPSADAWGYGLDPVEAPIKAFFHLVQDNEDRLTPIGFTRASELLLARHGDVMGDFLPTGSLQLAFNMSTEIACQVPGYELHYRQAPDFWRLIT